MNILIDYLSYLARARHRKGHGIHSPFVFDFVINVLRGNDTCDYAAITARRKELLSDRRRICRGNHGAGSKTGTTREREIRDIVKSSAVKPKYGRLLARTASWYKPGSVIELGTGAGMSSAYLSTGFPGCALFSIEGAKDIHDIARETVKVLSLRNVQLIHGSFAERLPPLLGEQVKRQNLLVFIDGDHNGEKVMAYCSLLFERLFEDLIIILDDINWSRSMKVAWNKLIRLEDITVSIDLFRFGILFVKKGVSKQHYVIRF